MKKINLGQKDIIHFVGIGGIGMSGLAQIMKNMGFRIQGSDLTKNKNTASCLKSGIKIFIGHSSRNVKKANIIVKSTAIKNSNTEIKFAKKNNIPIQNCVVSSWSSGHHHDPHEGSCTRVQFARVHIS